MMLARKRYTSPIDTSEVNDTFNERFKWAKYSSVYHPSVTTYYWNKWSTEIETSYEWQKYNAVSSTTYTWEKWNIGYGMVLNATGKKATLYHNSAGGCHLSAGAKPTVTSATTATQSSIVEYNVDTNGSGPVGKWQILKSGGKVQYLNNITSYNGIIDGYHTWTCTMYAIGQVKGSTKQGTVSSSSSTAYPTSGVSGNYWYCNRTSSTTYSKGSTYYGKVSSESSSAYPNNGRHSDGYWYANKLVFNLVKKGSTSYGTVSSKSPTGYPDNGHSGDYWYTYKSSSTSAAYYTKGDYVEDVKSVHEDEYPENGRHLDGFWYVKIE